MPVGKRVELELGAALCGGHALGAGAVQPRHLAAPISDEPASPTSAKVDGRSPVPDRGGPVTVLLPDGKVSRVTDLGFR